MNVKQISGFVLLGIGVILIFFSFHYMQELADAKGFVDDTKNFFAHNPTWNPIVTFFGGKAQEQIAQYDTPVTIALVLGILFTIAGSIMAFVYRKK